MGVVGGVQEESCAELTGGHPNPGSHGVCSAHWLLSTSCLVGPVERRPETTRTPEMLGRTAQQREKREIIKDLDPLGLKIRVMLLPSLQKELTAPTSPGHSPGALDLCLVLPRGLRFLKICAFLTCKKRKKRALNCFNLHYLITVKLARIFIFPGHSYFLTGLSPLGTLFCGVFIFSRLSFFFLNCLHVAFHGRWRFSPLVCSLSLGFGSEDGRQTRAM